MNWASAHIWFLNISNLKRGILNRRRCAAIVRLLQQTLSLRMLQFISVPAFNNLALLDGGLFNWPLRLCQNSLLHHSPLFEGSHSSVSFSLSVVLADREDQGERGMQPQGRGLDPGHLPVQVSLSGYPISDWPQDPHTHTYTHRQEARVQSLQSVSAGWLMCCMSTGQKCSSPGNEAALFGDKCVLCSSMKSTSSQKTCWNDNVQTGLFTSSTHPSFSPSTTAVIPKRPLRWGQLRTTLTSNTFQWKDPHTHHKGAENPACRLLWLNECTRCHRDESTASGKFFSFLFDN